MLFRSVYHIDQKEGAVFSIQIDTTSHNISCFSYHCAMYYVLKLDCIIYFIGRSVIKRTLAAKFLPEVGTKGGIQT